MLNQLFFLKIFTSFESREFIFCKSFGFGDYRLSPSPCWSRPCTILFADPPTIFHPVYEFHLQLLIKMPEFLASFGPFLFFVNIFRPISARAICLLRPRIAVVDLLLISIYFWTLWPHQRHLLFGQKWTGPIPCNKKAIGNLP